MDMIIIANLDSQGKIASIIMTWEMKILRKIYGPKCEQGVRRRRSNLELQNACKSPDIVTEIKIRRLEWLGHITRMEDTYTQKKMFNTKLEGRCGVARPKVRWLGDVEADIKTLGIKRWRLKAQDRKEWMVLLRGVRAKLKGPQNQRKNKIFIAVPQIYEIILYNSMT
jgi:hypothetical protein